MTLKFRNLQIGQFHFSVILILPPLTHCSLQQIEKLLHLTYGARITAIDWIVPWPLVNDSQPGITLLRNRVAQTGPIFCNFKKKILKKFWYFTIWAICPVGQEAQVLAVLT